MASSLPAWAGSVNLDTLTRLLALQSEHDWLDYKRQSDLSSPRGLVEFTKDVRAMMMTGGYILVGADDHGQSTGDVEHLDLFDPATLDAKLAKYLPRPFEIRVATHQHGGQDYALVYVVPHPDGFCIFERDGIYQDGKTQTVVFRAGEVFARHGTRSERWSQQDIALIKQRLRSDAERGRDQEAETLRLLQTVPVQLGGSGLWLAVAVVPQYPVADAPMVSPDAAQQFLREWQQSQAPIEGFGGGTATYRQPGSVVITSQSGSRQQAWFWRFALHDAGEGVGAHFLEQDAATGTDDGRWFGLPQSILDGRTIPVRRDLVEIHLLTLLDFLTAHAARVEAGGFAAVRAVLTGPVTDAWAFIALIDELSADTGQRQGWRLASARAHQTRDDVLTVSAVHQVRLADMRNPVIRIQAAHRIAADLLSVFGVDQPAVLKGDGTLDAYGAATDYQQLVYQHARHLGLPVDELSPAERRQRYESAIRTARDELRRR